MGNSSTTNPLREVSMYHIAIYDRYGNVIFAWSINPEESRDEFLVRIYREICVPGPVGIDTWELYDASKTH